MDLCRKPLLYLQWVGENKVAFDILGSYQSYWLLIVLDHSHGHDVRPPRRPAKARFHPVPLAWTPRDEVLCFQRLSSPPATKHSLCPDPIGTKIRPSSRTHTQHRLAFLSLFDLVSWLSFFTPSFSPMFRFLPHFQEGSTRILSISGSSTFQDSLWPKQGPGRLPGLTLPKPLQRNMSSFAIWLPEKQNPNMSEYLQTQHAKKTPRRTRGKGESLV